MIEDDDEEGALGLKDLGKSENVVSLQDTTILSLGTWARIAL